jgi:hypothetical protein
MQETRVRVEFWNPTWEQNKRIMENKTETVDFGKSRKTEHGKLYNSTKTQLTFA